MSWTARAVAVKNTIIHINIVSNYLIGAKLALHNAFDINRDSGSMQVRTMRYGKTTITFMGVSHEPETFETHKEPLVENIKKANLVVAETDRPSLNRMAADNDKRNKAANTTLRRFVIAGILEHDVKSHAFYDSVISQAEQSDKPVHCFESWGQTKKVSGFRKLVGGFGIIEMLAEYPRFAALLLPVTIYEIINNLFSRCSSVGSAGACVVMTILSIAFGTVLVDNVAELKRRNVSTALGLIKLIGEQQPKEIAVIYGGQHILDFVAYLTHPDLLRRHAKEAGLSSQVGENARLHSP